VKSRQQGEVGHESFFAWHVGGAQGLPLGDGQGHSGQSSFSTIAVTRDRQVITHRKRYNKTLRQSNRGSKCSSRHISRLEICTVKEVC